MISGPRQLFGSPWDTKCLELGQILGQFRRFKQDFAAQFVLGSRRMAIVLISWVCMSFLVCLALLSAAAQRCPAPDERIVAETEGQGSVFAPGRADAANVADTFSSASSAV
ncbi:hypothetical protein SBV1_1890005 [Verrucomicrobia bacterium]|nr:hypothetical protein SBV1_1890005 [Verrucomicrobiota bacterium]